MTLSTYIGIRGGGITGPEAYEFANTLVVPPDRRDSVVTDTKSYSGDETVRYLGNAPGQGFSAWLGVNYKDGAPYLSEDTFEEYENDEGGTSRYQTGKACDVEVNFDTGYAYRGPGDIGCADLHALYIRAIHDWVTERGGTIWWKNEFTGDYFEGLDGLREFGNAGEEAFSWFSNVVQPVIAAEVAAEGGEVTWF